MTEWNKSHFIFDFFQKEITPNLSWGWWRLISPHYQYLHLGSTKFQLIAPLNSLGDHLNSFTGCSLGSWCAGSSSVYRQRLWTESQQLGASSGWLWLGCPQGTAVWWGCGWPCTWPATGRGTAGHCSCPQSPRRGTAPLCQPEENRVFNIKSCCKIPL